MKRWVITCRYLFAGLLVAAQAINAHADGDWASVATGVPDVHLAKPGEMMRADEPLHISISLKIRDEAGLDMSISKAEVGGSAAATPLTSQQFLERFAPTESQVNAVISYLNASGFKNVTVAANRLIVGADGSAGAAATAFHVSMRHFTVGGRNAYANINAPLVPAQFGNIILSIAGLQTVNVPHRLKGG